MLASIGSSLVSQHPMPEPRLSHSLIPIPVLSLSLSPPPQHFTTLAYILCTNNDARRCYHSSTVLQQVCNHWCCRGPKYPASVDLFSLVVCRCCHPNMRWAARVGLPCCMLQQCIVTVMKLTSNRRPDHLIRLQARLQGHWTAEALHLAQTPPSSFAGLAETGPAGPRLCVKLAPRASASSRPLPALSGLSSPVHSQDSPDF